MSTQAQTSDPNCKYIRPTNTGFGGDYFRTIEVDKCGNKWSGGYLPFYSEGSVVRFDDSTFTAWSNFEGFIPNAQVYGIAFDQNNGVWVACNANMNFNEHGGVAHYDGSTWTKWDMSNSLLPTDLKNAIAIDHNNNVWVTFSDFANSIGGVAKYSGTTWTVYTPSNSGLPTTEVTDIDVDAQNNIWMGSNLGLIKFDGLNWISFTSTNSGISFNLISDVDVDESAKKIYAATTISIDIYDGTNWSHINTSNAPFPNINLTEIESRVDTVIIGSLGGISGAWIYDGINGISHISPGHIKDVRIDNDGYFWTCGNGFVEKYDGIIWTTYSSMNTGSTSMLNNDVFVDSKNRAWLSSNLNGGINMFDCPKWQDYNHYNYNLWNIPFSYTGTGAGITEDSYGDIWKAYDGLAGGVAQVTSGDVNNPAAWHLWVNANSGVSLQFLRAIAADQSGNVYIGHSGDCSVSKYSHASNSWTNFNLYIAGNTVCISGDGLNSIRVDDSNNVWFCGTYGLAKYDQINLPLYNSFNSPLPQDNIEDMAFDTLGNKWIATEQGVYKFDGTTWTQYNSSNTGMIADWVNSLLIDNNGILWVGCEEAVFPPYPAGLCSFYGTAWIQYITNNSGLQEKFIRRMALDTLGNIWVLSRGKGAAIFNPNGVIGFDYRDRTLQACIPTSANELSENNNSSLTVFPNPFTTSTTLEFILSETQNVSISIFDVIGREIKTIATNNLQAGKNNLIIDSSELMSGIYICEIKTGKNVRVIKLIK